MESIPTGSVFINTTGTLTVNSCACDGTPINATTGLTFTSQSRYEHRRQYFHRADHCSNEWPRQFVRRLQRDHAHPDSCRCVDPDRGDRRRYIEQRLRPRGQSVCRRDYQLQRHADADTVAISKSIFGTGACASTNADTNYDRFDRIRRECKQQGVRRHDGSSAKPGGSLVGVAPGTTR